MTIITAPVKKKLKLAVLIRILLLKEYRGESLIFKFTK